MGEGISFEVQDGFQNDIVSQFEHGACSLPGVGVYARWNHLMKRAKTGPDTQPRMRMACLGCEEKMTISAHMRLSKQAICSADLVTLGSWFLCGAIECRPGAQG